MSTPCVGGDVGERLAAGEGVAELGLLEAEDLGEVGAAAESAMAAMAEPALGCGLDEGCDDGVELGLGDGAVVDEALERLAEALTGLRGGRSPRRHRGLGVVLGAGQAGGQEGGAGERSTEGGRNGGGGKGLLLHDVGFLF